MENRNIYKMDDFLIITSYIMIIPLILIAWPWLRSFGSFESLGDYFRSAPLILGPRLTALILYGCAGISSQIIGRIIRYGERQSLEILDTLQFYKKTTISQLASQLDLSEAKVTSLVRKMSRISSLGITVEGEQVSIGAAPEATAGYTSTFTTSTPEPESEPMTSSTVEETEPEKPSKDFSSFNDEFKEALRKATDKNLSESERKEEMKKYASSISMGKAPQIQGQKKFNFVLFIILFLTPLWPIALIYAISFAVKQRNSALSNRNTTE